MDRLTGKDQALIKLSLFLMREKWLQNHPVMKKIRKILVNKNLVEKRMKFISKK
ncbi:MAG: hypothetical protein Q7S42_05025 [Candidatus Omnitrophota bacterium]|nr:hypothetical protein [Candidatus Omnitrophota bacterium]